MGKYYFIKIGSTWDRPALITEDISKEATQKSSQYGEFINTNNLLLIKVLAADGEYSKYVGTSTFINTNTINEKLSKSEIIIKEFESNGDALAWYNRAYPLERK